MSKQTALKLEKRYGKHCVNNLGEANGTQVEDRYNREICIIIKLEWGVPRSTSQFTLLNHCAYERLLVELHDTERPACD